MRKRYTTTLFIGIVIVLPAAAWAMINWYGHTFQSLPVIAGRPGSKQEHRISDFRLLNQQGEERSITGWNRKIVIADFFFTHCPAICPKMTSNMKRLQQAYGPGTGVWFASFTVDPGRDSSLQLKRYAERFELDLRNWDLLTGDKKELYRLARNSFMIVATDGDGGPGDFIHSDKLVLVDPQQRIRGYYDGTDQDEADRLLNDIKKLQHEN
ncbi:MAG: SCO family protein [Chitinophagaceae bacterium]